MIKFFKNIVPNPEERQINWARVAVPVDKEAFL